MTGPTLEREADALCPHCLRDGNGRLKLNRYCPHCGEPVHRGCLKHLAPAHPGFQSHCESLRRSGISPGSVFPQMCDYPRTAVR